MIARHGGLGEPSDFDLLLLVLQVGTAVVLFQVATREALPLCLQAPMQEQPSGASSLAGSA